MQIMLHLAFAALLQLVCIQVLGTSLLHSLQDEDVVDHGLARTHC